MGRDYGYGEKYVHAHVMSSFDRREIGVSNRCARGFPGLIPPNASLVL